MRVQKGSVGGSITRSTYYGTNHKSTTEDAAPRFSYFDKPDEVVRNTKVNGYRKPSNYAASTSGMYQHLQFNLVIPHWSGLPNRSEIEGAWPIRAVAPSITPISPNNVRMKVLNNVKDELFDAAMVLAEMQGTVSTLSNNLLRIGRSMDAIRKRKRPAFDFLMHGRRPRNLRGKRLDKFNREVSGIYLEWKYGIMPTVYDVQGACKAMDMNEKGGLFDNPPLMVARSKDVVTSEITCSLIHENAGGFTWQGSVPAVLRQELKARLDFRVSGDYLRGFNRYGLGLGTLATIAFERTPFSFVLNMAVPIAELIKAWSALAGVQTLGYCETSFSEVKITKDGSAQAVGSSEVLKTKGPASERAFQRTAFATVPFPVPFVRNPIKTGNVATVLALFTTLRK